MPFDITATKAHAKGLEKAGILSAAEVKKIITTLGAMEKDLAAGNLCLAQLKARAKRMQ